MAQLTGNNITEWIAALEPVTDWSQMAAGTKIIHLSSQTMEPDFFATLMPASGSHPDMVLYYNDQDCAGSICEQVTSGWFYFPEPAQEVSTLPAAQIKSRVRELGDGKWQSLK